MLATLWYVINAFFSAPKDSKCAHNYTKSYIKQGF